MKPVQSTHAAVFLLAFLLAACSDDGNPVGGSARPAMVVRAGAGTAAVTVFAGEVRARYEPALAFRVAGKISRRLVEVGEQVHAGQVLAELDPADLDLQLEAARAHLVSAEAEHTLAGAELERHRNLLERQLISPSLFETQEAAFRVAEARLHEARAQAETAGNQASYAELRAPAGGLIVQRFAEAGQVVAAGQSVFLLAVAGEREVAINLPEQSAGTITPESELLVELWALPGELIPGRLREVSPAADSASRTYSARVTLGKSELRVELGQSARVYTAGSGPDTLVLPLSALHARDGKPAVWIVDPQTSRVRLAPVVIGPLGEAGFPVIEGVAPDNWVVAAGVHLLSENELIRPVDGENRPVVLSAPAATPESEAH